MDKRHKQRIEIIQNLFAASFKLQNNLPYPKNPTTPKILKKIDTIDRRIVEYAPKFPIDRIAKTDLMILRLAIYELEMEKKEPEKVIINEAVELAKELGGDRSYAFVNAVLGNVVKK